MPSESYLWLANVTTWQPDTTEWERALSFVQQEEQVRIRKFRFPIDAKRSLVGRLLMRHLIHIHTGVDYSKIVLQRTKAGKPFWANPVPEFASLSFNISHHADYVILAAHTRFTVGCDVMDMNLRGQDQKEFFRLMESSYHPTEWKLIIDKPSPSAQLQQFFVLWTLKESFIKNIGVGLQLELDRMQFYHLIPKNAGPFDEMRLNVVQKGDAHDMDASPFRFQCFPLDDNHLACVCLGPLTAAVSRSAKDWAASASPDISSSTATASSTTSSTSASSASSSSSSVWPRSTLVDIAAIVKDFTI